MVGLALHPRHTPLSCIFRRTLHLKRARSTTYSAEMWYGLPCRWSFQKPCFQKRKPSISRLVLQNGVYPYGAPWQMQHRTLVWVPKECACSHPPLVLWAPRTPSAVTKFCSAL